jgi:hypothetical protein
MPWWLTKPRRSEEFTNCWPMEHWTVLLGVDVGNADFARVQILYKVMTSMTPVWQGGKEARTPMRASQEPWMSETANRTEPLNFAVTFKRHHRATRSHAMAIGTWHLKSDICTQPTLIKLITGICIEYSQFYPSVGLVVPAALLHPLQMPPCLASSRKPACSARNAQGPECSKLRQNRTLIN